MVVPTRPRGCYTCGESWVGRCAVVAGRAWLGLRASIGARVALSLWWPRVSAYNLTRGVSVVRLCSCADVRVFHRFPLQSSGILLPRSRTVADAVFVCIGRLRFRSFALLACVRALVADRRWYTQRERRFFPLSFLVAARIGLLLLVGRW